MQKNVRNKGKKCRVFSCSRHAVTKELCKTHYTRLLYHTSHAYRDKRREYQRDYYRRHPKEAAEATKRWLKKHPEKAVSYAVRYAIKHDKYVYVNFSKRGIDNIYRRKNDYERQMRNFVRMYSKKRGVKNERK